MAITYTSLDTQESIEGRREVTAWLKAAINAEGFAVGDIAIAFCSDSYILEANRTYLSHDYFTDIITFDYSTAKKLSGDLLISVDTVRSNAKIFEVEFRDELMRVIIHGILHLCGYGDKSDEEKITMRNREDHYLRMASEHLTKK